ncbi:hypothetical protein [Actinotignum sanguinis]|uniref:Uncharacterized protein n=1 Tax=Actinotignum sanguinis TaxID=1445614 RepID=A0ABT5V7H8_9ACTO|nr:hypothetical protein [Actinotignum sanguinis]MDE1552503.1 hypothetical protein [Actinotignum sanguinis]MDE1642033.1 hypothetical protein [Actinotignum sanguinis]MDE1656923.1 hypothetical protein [Actinotignum sanguinis]MDK8352732.1 hypothetical protein [Actinotignum sanguinis]
MTKETRQQLEANIAEVTLETQNALEQALLAAYPPASENWVDQVAARQTAAATARMEAAYEAAAIMDVYEEEESLEIWKNQDLPEPLPTILANEWMTQYWDLSDWVLRGEQLEDPEAIAEMRAEMIEQAENRVEEAARDWLNRLVDEVMGRESKELQATFNLAYLKDAFKNQHEMNDLDPFILSWEAVEKVLIEQAPIYLRIEYYHPQPWAVELKEAGLLMG